MSHIGWWCLGLAHASFLCVSKICLMLMLSSWSGGLPAQSAVHSWPFMWAAFWFPTPLRGWALLDVGLCLFSVYSLTAIISCHITLSFLLWHLFETILLYPFGSAIYFFPSGLVWPLVFYYITCELLCPICFLLVILGSFAFLGIPWPFS